MLVKVLQRKRTGRIYRDVQKEIYYEESADMIMEAEKSLQLPSASWRPRKVGSRPNPKAWEPVVWVPVRVQGWRTPACPVRAISTQCADSNAHHFQKLPRRCTQNDVLPAVWGAGYPLARSSWHIKLTITGVDTVIYLYVPSPPHPHEHTHEKLFFTALWSISWF